MWPVLSPSAAADNAAAQPIRDAFGTDLFFDGQLRVTPHGDFQESSGEDNLRRAIYRRLATRPGDYKARPSYGAGVPQFVKKSLTRSNLDALRTRIIEQVSQDRRVDRVLECSATPYIFDGVPGVLVHLVVQATGRTVRFSPLGFAQE